MRNSWLIALRELKERMGSRSFVLMSFFGPIIILCLIYFLFAFGGEGKQHWNVLISDPSNLLDNKIMAQEDQSINYSFSDQYIEMEEFRDAKKFQQYDALFEVNEKVLSNKTAFVFYRLKPSVRMQTRLQFHIERRIEEVMIEQFTDLSVKEFRKIKQPLNVAFRDVFDPLDEASDLRGWVGFFYGAIIFVFIFLFGMTILRSVSREKSNRIVEVLLASVHPNQLLTGKIVGIGIAAFFQFIIWMVVVGAGLYFMRELIFPDLLDASNMDIVQMTDEVKNQTRLDQMYAASEYNEFVNLVYERVQFGIMTAFFLVFFIVGYLFYGSFFAAVGATSGSESDGQQFVLPIIFLLCFSLYAGYFALQNPESSLTTFFHYLPFTSPVVVMVKLAQGYAPEESMQIYIALIILVVSAVLNLMIAGRLYKNGILQFGHRVKFSMIVRWLKKT
jgi:ABC-2 type transport system permease protein